ncbi:hypothetical protein ACN28S_49405 [Cystobacter fuscus]
MWRNGKEWPDILGAAVRFLRQNHITEDAVPGDQDLLFSTMRHMWTIAPAVLSTRVHDFLENDYYGIAPFRVDGVGRVKLRLTSPRDATPRQGSRVERLQEAMSTGTAVLTVEARSLDSGAPHTGGPWRRSSCARKSPWTRSACASAPSATGSASPPSASCTTCAARPTSRAGGPHRALRRPASSRRVSSALVVSPPGGSPHPDA